MGLLGNKDAFVKQLCPPAATVSKTATYDICDKDIGVTFESFSVQSCYFKNKGDNHYYKVNYTVVIWKHSISTNRLNREVKQMNGYVYGNLCCYTHTYTHYLFILYLVKHVARVRVRVLSNCYIFILLTNMSSPIIWPLWSLRHCFRYTWKRDMICWYDEIKHIWYSIKSIYFQV